MPNPILRQRLEAGEYFYAPGVFDMMSTVIAAKHGFEALYISGYWMSASLHGLPDVGVATYSEFIQGIERVAGLTDAALIADADTGFGGLLNLKRTVEGYEKAGVTAIQIEDQEFPKKCGHTPHKQLIPAEDMVTKVKVAVDSRKSDDFLIIARTDARASEGLEAALERAASYGEAGADLLFVEAPQSEDEMRAVCAMGSKPQLANMALGGMTPLLSNDQLAEIGYAGAIFPAAAPLVAIEAVNRLYGHMKAKGEGKSADIPAYDFYEFCRDIGFEEVWDFEKRWGRYE